MRWQPVLKYLSILLLCGVSSAILANPPFITDDPFPTEYQHWEAYLFSFLDKTNPGTTLSAPGIEFDWGATPTTEFHAVLPLNTYFFPNGPSPTGVGDLETGIKYLLIKEAADMPQITFAPIFYVPIGDEEQRLGNGSFWMRLPLAIGKTWGDWTAYGSGGFALNTGSGQQNFPYGGIVVQRNIGKKWMIGGEVYSQGQSNDLVRQFTSLTLGCGYNFTENFSLLSSIAYSIQGQSNLISYLGLYYTW